MHKVGDRVAYVGRAEYPCEPKRGALGTVTWVGDIKRIDQPWLTGWVRVKWDDPPTSFEAALRPDQVRPVQ